MPCSFLFMRVLKWIASLDVSPAFAASAAA
jgi:hypothetical protein